MKIIVVEPVKPAYLKEIRNTLQDMQKVVGGYIEPFNYSDDGCVYIVNEEGQLLNLPCNRIVGAQIIRGTFFICRDDADNESFASVTDEDTAKYLKMYSKPETFQKGTFLFTP